MNARKETHRPYAITVPSNDHDQLSPGAKAELGTYANHPKPATANNHHYSQVQTGSDSVPEVQVCALRT